MKRLDEKFVGGVIVVCVTLFVIAAIAMTIKFVGWLFAPKPGQRCQSDPDKIEAAFIRCLQGSGEFEDFDRNVDPTLVGTCRESAIKIYCGL